jgi:hypothetical protein
MRAQNGASRHTRIGKKQREDEESPLFACKARCESALSPDIQLPAHSKRLQKNGEAFLLNIHYVFEHCRLHSSGYPSRGHLRGEFRNTARDIHGQSPPSHLILCVGCRRAVLKPEAPAVLVNRLYFGAAIRLFSHSGGMRE